VRVEELLVSVLVGLDEDEALVVEMLEDGVEDKFGGEAAAMASSNAWL
jgi:hypothetical protein